MLFISPQNSFVLKLFKFLSWAFGHVENNLIKKIKVISKCMTSQPGKQNTAIHILPNISTSKDNQTMKFGQLIDYNVRNIFLKKTYTKCDGETSLRPFYFSCMSKLRPIEIYWIEAARPPALTSYKAFLKNKKRSGTSLSVSFSAWFLKKNIFSCYINWPNFIV